ncbi:succinylglutamate desuccinylase/aspartoacylase family protein [Vibrio ishigakensis]|uniref:succinylglutamate desuccinylase/aspartoacylase family protein n=1 Tax=Vibrio ishigakensis TaxID=1481914 RepID=UPI0021C4BC80|nr:succinylglutamate desuccinylase/aspartoacylase family protein [Vibrio ishigakensis]
MKTVTTTLPVLESLDVDQLETGEHKFEFAVATNALGQRQHLPVRVFKGDKPGKKVVITAGVHGDEQSGIVAALKLANELVDKAICGCVTIVPAVNPTGILRHSRDFYPADPDTSPSNMNRYFPGNPEGNEVQRFIASLWSNLLRPSADIAIDLHTQTSGTTYPLYVFADYRVDAAKQMALQLNPDVILDDPGEKGILETAWNESGVPCITIEVGAGRYIDSPMVERTIEGMLDILKMHGVVQGDAQPIQSCIEGKNITSIKAKQGGFVECHVSLMQEVEQGELLATQMDSFGDVIEKYHAPSKGTVLSHCVEALRAPGSLVVRLIS